MLDGFPRNAAQAEALDELLEELDRPLDVVLDLQVPDDVCMERLMGRAEEGGPHRRQPRGDREAARDLPSRNRSR